MANVLTGCRIVFSIALLFAEPFSLKFCILYLLAGITDMIDGTVARIFNQESKFGEKFDTAADFVFVVAVLYKIIPVVTLPGFVLLWIGLIALVKIANMIVCYVRNGELVAVHSHLNKITGLALFIFPLTLNLVDIRISACFVCALASCAAIHELFVIRKK